jgi:NAD(P)-dependent dehydrogenase (short-subunit alcohol dehydrogenase family)
MPDRPRALVTGANRGLGQEVARQLGREGYVVLLGCRDVATGEESAEALRGEGLEVRVVDLDVTDPAGIARFTESLDSSLDVLVNNAGVALDGFDEAVVRRTLDVNFHGALRVTDALESHLAAGARVVMVSSGMGSLSSFPRGLRDALMEASGDRDALLVLARRFAIDVATGNHRRAGWPSSAYSVSKALLNALVRVLHRSWSGDGRDFVINAVCPGWVRTHMGGASAPRSLEEGAASILWAATLDERGPSGGFFRDGNPIEW